MTSSPSSGTSARSPRRWSGGVGGGGVRILHWLEISNFKIYRSSGRMPLEGQVRRFGGFARVALRKLAILDGTAPICTSAVS
jgi:hypothetical protein